jgi:hypothetical protein
LGLSNQDFTFVSSAMLQAAICGSRETSKQIALEWLSTSIRSDFAAMLAFSFQKNQDISLFKPIFINPEVMGSLGSEGLSEIEISTEKLIAIVIYLLLNFYFRHSPWNCDGAAVLSFSSCFAFSIWKIFFKRIQFCSLRT